MDTSETIIRIEFSGDRADQYTLAEANVALAPIGSRIWPLDLSNVPTNLANLLSRSTLTEEENKRLKSYFLLPRERLLEIITEAGRQPCIPGGGALSTKDETNSVQYPQLYVADPSIDYSRFDRLHINRADNGIAVDEIGQLISGHGFIFCHQLDSGDIIKIHLSCPNEKTGWLTTHSGGFPHIANFTTESIGTKAVIQVIGPESWKMHYVDES
ncbi:MAG: hypothetical protein AAGG02_16055 [Cyanobacteria bacterium P01_H01_bin.15]